MIQSKSSSLNSCPAPCFSTPAQVTMLFTSPNSLRASSIMRSHDAALLTSTATATAPGRSPAICFAASSLTSAHTTWSPRSESALAVAAPMPEPAPVIIATAIRPSPLITNECLFFLGSRYYGRGFSLPSTLIVVTTRGGSMHFGVGLFSLQNTAMLPAHWAGAYRDMREYATLMEELGYDELWLSEHHFFYDGYCSALF